MQWRTIPGGFLCLLPAMVARAVEPLHPEAKAPSKPNIAATQKSQQTAMTREMAPSSSPLIRPAGRVT
jgi:hypothetical protein